MAKITRSAHGSDFIELNQKDIYELKSGKVVSVSGTDIKYEESILQRLSSNGIFHVIPPTAEHPNYVFHGTYDGQFEDTLTPEQVRKLSEELMELR